MTPELRLAALPFEQPLTGQVLYVAVRSADIIKLRPETDIRLLPDPETQIVDIVALLASGAAQGLFSADPATPVSGRAERLPDTEPRTAAWRLRVAGASVGVVRLLVNMAGSLGLEAISVLPLDLEAGPVTPHGTLHYPDCRVTEEFQFTYELPQKSRVERAVRIGFTRPPSDTALDQTIEALDVWGNLLMAGAYAEDWAPMASGVMVEAASMEDDTTVSVSLPICFGATKSMFAPVINLARRVHRHSVLAFLEII